MTSTFKEQNKRWAVQVLVRGLVLAPVISILLGAVAGLLLGLVSDIRDPMLAGVLIIGGIGIVTTLQHWRAYIAAFQELLR